MSERLLAAVKAFENLQTVQIMPGTYHGDIFTPILAELASRTSLADLRVNSWCTDDESPSLTRIVGLRRLELKSPSRAILQLLPGWLERLTSLKELHLTVGRFQSYSGCSDVFYKEQLWICDARSAASFHPPSSKRHRLFLRALLLHHR
jgi:hypothetical protein